MKTYVLLFITIFCIGNNCNSVFAQSQYNVNFDSLVLKSDAVILEDITEVEIPDNFSAEYTVYKKVLN